MPRKTRRQKLHADMYRVVPVVEIDSSAPASSPSSQIRYQFHSSAPKKAAPAAATGLGYEAVRADLTKTVAISALMITAIIVLGRMWQ